MSESIESAGREPSAKAAINLKDADSPNQVEAILKRSFFDDAEWKALGQMENNYGVVENQAGAPMPALVEVIVNSYDAVLMKGFHEHVGTTDPDPESDELPNFEGQYEAREVLLDNDDHVELRADGFKPTDKDIINFTVIDNGCGQPPERFEKTFLGLLEPGKYKQDYPFLQGQYGMGSTGVLQFCGGRSYKFICSAASSDTGRWSWSIIRQNREKGRYEYLTIGGDVPTFDGTLENRTHGTFVKMYDYELSVTKTVLTGDTRFQKRLERFLVDPPFALSLNDTRYPTTQVTERDAPGLLSRIEQYDQLVKEDYDIRYNFDNERLGIRDIHVYTFKDNDEIEKLQEKGEATTRNKGRFVGGDEHRDMAVLYTVNGQTHGNEGETFITNRCKKPRVGKDTLVLVDFSDLAGTDMVDLFQPTRDRIKQSAIGRTLQDGIEDALTNDDWLIEEEDRRRQKLASDESDEILDESLQSILEEDPDLQQFFETGDKATADKPAEERAPYNPPEVPDTFEIIETYDVKGDHEFYDEDEHGRYSLDIPVNRARQIRFYLNAPNNYLSSDSSGGELRVKPALDAVKWTNLNRGILTLGLTAPDEYEPDDVLTLIFNVTRPEKDSLTQRVEVRFTPEEEPASSGGNTSKPKGSAGLSLPNITRVEEDDWDKHEFDEQDVVRIATAGDSISDMDIYVNIHSAPVRRFLQNRNLRKTGKEFVLERYVMATALYSVSMYIEFTQQYDAESILEFASPEEIVASSMRGMGQVLLHTVAPKQLLSEYS